MSGQPLRKKSDLLKTKSRPNEAFPFFKHGSCILVARLQLSLVYVVLVQLPHCFLPGLFMTAAGLRRVLEEPLLEELLTFGFCFVISCGTDFFGFVSGSRCLTMTPCQHCGQSIKTNKCLKEKKRWSFLHHQKKYRQTRTSYSLASASSNSSDSKASSVSRATSGCLKL